MMNFRMAKMDDLPQLKVVYGKIIEEMNCNKWRQFGVRAFTVRKSFYRFAGFRKTRKNKKASDKLIVSRRKK